MHHARPHRSDDSIEANSRVLILGASGMLGRELLRLAPTEDELGRPINVGGADIQEVDITDAEAVHRYVAHIAPRVVINCAAYTDVDGCESNREKAFAVNGAGAGHVAAAARACGARLLHISTDFVFDGEKEEPYVEEDIPRPINVYGESKLEGERRVQDVGGDWIIVRTAWLYGRHGKNFVDTILRLARTRTEISVVTDIIGCPTSAADLAAVIWHLALSPLRGIYHAVNQGSCSRFEQAREIVRLAGLACEVRATTSDAFPLPARRPACVILSTEKLQAATGQAMRSWRAALAAYLGGG